MATTHASMSYAHFGSNATIDPADLDNWVDFNAIPSPASRPASRLPSDSAITSPASTVVPLDSDDFQPAKPSHDYSGFRQQTGIPTGNLGLSAPTQGYRFDGFGSGLGMDFLENNSFGMDIDMNSNSNGDLPAFFFPNDNNNSQSDDFIDPSSIQEEQPQRNIRFFPGMHQQQAQQQALARAQEQAKQLKRQQMLQAAQQQQQQQQTVQARSQSTGGKRASASPIDARTEEIIGRVVNQIRQNSNSQNGFSPSGNVLPHVGRIKKDEEDMDEDERLLASEEGKKLSSKERRQLRNKVSARAFRSRRKEYIGQLEGEVAAKATECTELRTQNQALLEENARSRAFIEKLLRHPAFNPFLDELSRDASILESLPKLPPAVPSQSSVLSNSQDFNTPVSSQPTADASFMTMSSIPENSLDMSMLNLSNNSNANNSWNSLPVQNGYGFNQPQVFAVMEVPAEPELPDFSAISGKSQDSFTSITEKVEYPVIEHPVESEPEFTSSAAVVEVPAELELYADSPSTTTAPSTPLFSNIVLPAKSIPHFQLVVSNTDEASLMKSLDRLCAIMEPSFERVKSATESFGF